MSRSELDRFSVLRARLRLAHLPTPIEEPRGLEPLLGDRGRGTRIFVKRDDMTGGPCAGNKIRKLEYLLAAAVSAGATTVITCGGIQSNHARATCILARTLGMNAIVLLRTTDAERDVRKVAPTGNLFLDRMVGADVRLISPEQYRRRAELMAEVAEEVRAKGGTPYVIPEGGSNALGSLGYVRAMNEIARQLEVGVAGGAPFDMVVHACGSGGTAAGVVVGAKTFGVAKAARAMAVCDDVAYFTGVVSKIVGELAETYGFGDALPIDVDDRAKGPAYAVATSEQKSTIVDVARRTGLLLDPVYTGKAFVGMVEAVRAGEVGGRVLFLHTGGLPGLLADAGAFSAEL